MSIMASDAGAFTAATGLFASKDGAWHEVPLGGGGLLWHCPMRFCGSLHAGASASVIVTAPHICAGDLVLVIAGQYNSGGARSLGLPTADGLTFTEIVQSPTDLSGIGAWYAVASASARPLAVTVPVVGGTSTPHAAVYVVPAATPAVGVGGTAAAYASTNTPTVPGMTAGPNMLAVAAITVRDDVTPYPTSPGWEVMLSQNFGTSMSMAVAARVMSTSGATGDCSFQYTANGPDPGVYARFALNLPSSPAPSAVT